MLALHLGWTRPQNQVSYAGRAQGERPISAVDSSRAVELPAETPIPQNPTPRVFWRARCAVGVPLLLWFVPLGIEPKIQGALADHRRS